MNKDLNQIINSKIYGLILILLGLGTFSIPFLNMDYLLDMPTWIGVYYFVLSALVGIAIGVWGSYIFDNNGGTKQ